MGKNNCNAQTKAQNKKELSSVGPAEWKGTCWNLQTASCAAAARIF